MQGFKTEIPYMALETATTAREAEVYLVGLMT